MARSRYCAFGGRLLGAAAAAGVLWLSAGAPAQSDVLSAAKPPTAKVPDRPPLVGNIVAGIVILAVVLTAGLLPSKRGHQD